MQVRGRFAPTPSGELHLGNAFTALLAWLQVRAAGGVFVLRIEDLDLARYRKEFAQRLVDDLRWLGIDWDEGPDVGGPHGPYRQSMREDWYQAALTRLSEAGLLYPCYCSRQDSSRVAQAPHGLAAAGHTYPGTCRHLSAQDRLRKAARKSPSTRFRMEGRDLDFVDLVFGVCHYPGDYGGDFIVLRADGVISYQLAVVVDDYEMGITHVLRGSDLLDSTPRQLRLQRALGFTEPTYAHVPLLLAPDGRRLAKRDASTTLSALRRRGVSADTVVGHLAYFAGLIDRPEPVVPRELIAEFDSGKLPTSSIRLSENWMMGLVAR